MKNLCTIICCLFLFACSENSDSSTVQPQSQVKNTPQTSQKVQQNEAIFSTITPAEANQLIQNKKNLLLLDVRSPEELREGKITGSTLVPFWEIAKGKYTVPKTQPVLLICAVGGRSYAVGQYLNRSGYPEVYNLKGGLSGWKQAGLPVVY